MSSQAEIKNLARQGLVRDAADVAEMMGIGLSETAEIITDGLMTMPFTF